MTNKGLKIDLFTMNTPDGLVAALDVIDGSNYYLSIYLERESPEAQQFYRVKSDRLCKVDALGKKMRIFVRQPLDL